MLRVAVQWVGGLLSKHVLKAGYAVGPPRIIRWQNLASYLSPRT